MKIPTFQDPIVQSYNKKVKNGGEFDYWRIIPFRLKMLSYLTEDEDCDFEFGPLQKIAKDGQLKAFSHEGFWQCMDNVRERDYLSSLIVKNKAPWIKLIKS